MRRGTSIAVAFTPLLGACGALIGAEWEGSLAPEAAPISNDAGDPDAGAPLNRGDARDGDASDAAALACDACGPTNAIAIAAGENHTCAIVPDGILCWGQNAIGQLGTGDDTFLRSASPRRVTGITKASAIAAGYSHTCAIVDEGAVECWGWNAYAQLGGGSLTPTSIATPVRVVGLPGPATAIAASWATTCAVVAGAAYCWGNNDYGWLGTDTAGTTLAPTLIPGLETGVTSIESDIQRTCAIVDGAVKCWGFSWLGDGTTSSSKTPVAVFGAPSGATAVSVGQSVACVVVAGALSCWGLSNEGGLGDPAKTMAIKPNPVPGLAAGVTAIGASDRACAIVNGGIKCWGAYPGNGSPSSKVPVTVSGTPGANASAIAVAQKHACAIASGEVWCWGSNTSEQLGVSRAATGGSAEALTPVRVGD